MGNAPGSSPRWLHVVFVLTLLLFVAIGFFAYRGISDYLSASVRLARSGEVHDRLDHFVSALKDIQRGARGYVITADPRYLEPYNAGKHIVAAELEVLQRITAGRDEQVTRMKMIREFTHRLISLNTQEVEFVSAGNIDSARAVVRSGEAKEAMDAIDSITSDMKGDEVRLAAAHQEEADADLRRFLVLLCAAGMLDLGLLIGIFLVMRRQLRSRQVIAARLELSEHRLLTIVNSIHEGITFSNVAGGFEVFNHRMKELTGYSIEEANRSGDFSRLLYPDPEERQQALDGVQQVLEQPGIHNSETTITTRSGARKTLRVSSQMLRHRDRKMFLTTYEDITRQKDMEKALHLSMEKFQMIFDNAYDGISIFEETPDPDQRRLVECNARYAENAGRSREELLLIGVTRDLATPLQENIRVMGERGPEMRGEFSWIRPDGAENIIEFTARTIQLDGKALTIGIDRDVTQARRAVAEREQLITDLQQALADVKTLSGLVPICAHCKKIRDDQGYWTQLEAFIQARTSAHFSHGICPECIDRFYRKLPGAGNLREAESQA